MGEDVDLKQLGSQQKFSPLSTSGCNSLGLLGGLGAVTSLADHFGVETYTY